MQMADPLTLKAIAAAVVDGIALTGGWGSVYIALIVALGWGMQGTGRDSESSCSSCWLST